MSSPRQSGDAYGDTVNEKLAAVRDEMPAFEKMILWAEESAGSPLPHSRQWLAVLRRYERLLTHVQYQCDHQIKLPGFDEAHR